MAVKLLEKISTIFLFRKMHLGHFLGTDPICNICRQKDCILAGCKEQWLMLESDKRQLKHPAFPVNF